MGSVYTDDESRSQIARRLSVLPSVVGVFGVLIMTLGSAATGLIAEPRGWGWVVLAASLVLATVVSGTLAGLYIGLAMLVVAVLATGDPLTLAELLATVLTVLATHETVRFSLDARRPSRFGPGLVGGYMARTTALAALVVVAVGVAWPLSGGEPRSLLWMPLGLAATAVPLLARDGAGWLDRRGWLEDRSARAALAAALSLVVVAVVVIAAQARTAIDSGPVGDGPTSQPTTPPTTVPLVLVDSDPVSIRWLLLFIGLVAVVLALGVLYLALRRPEAVFELDEIDQARDDVSFGFAIPGRADQQDESVELEDRDLERLLRDLQLDIATEPDPGRAIRYGYATIEGRLADLGLTRADSETEREFLARAIPGLGEAGPSMTSLTSLFESARFGSRPVDEPMRSQALNSIEQLLNGVTGLDRMSTGEPIEEPAPAEEGRQR